MDPPIDLFLVVANAIMLMIRPKHAKGIFNQLREPRHGKKAINIPIPANIPHTKLRICIFNLLYG